MRYDSIQAWQLLCCAALLIAFAAFTQGGAPPSKASVKKERFGATPDGVRWTSTRSRTRAGWRCAW
jgi:hypothetical protein